MSKKEIHDFFVTPYNVMQVEHCEIGPLFIPRGADELSCMLSAEGQHDGDDDDQFES